MSFNPGDGGPPKFGKMVPGGGVGPDPAVPPSAVPPSAVPYDAGMGASPFVPPAAAVPPNPGPGAVPAFGLAPAADPSTGLTATDPVLFTLGDIAVSRSWVVTPNGTAPIHGSTWIGQDMSRTETKTPTWAIVLAIFGFLLCLIGLLFLLVKEERTTGYFEVTVQSGAVRHVTQLPVSNAGQVAHYRQMVHQAQSLAAAA